jgi:hypothetical protein
MLLAFTICFGDDAAHSLFPGRRRGAALHLRRSEGRRATRLKAIFSKQAQPQPAPFTRLGDDFRNVFMCTDFFLFGLSLKMNLLDARLATLLQIGSVLAVQMF